MMRVLKYFYRVIGILFLCLGVLAPAAVCPGQDAGIKHDITLNAEEFYIGDPIELTVKVCVPGDMSAEIPDIAEYLEGADIRDFNASEGSFNGGKCYKHTYVFALFETGDFNIPSFTVYYVENEGSKRRELKTSPLKIAVKSLLEENPQQTDIYDIKEPVYFKSVLLYPFLIAAAVIAALIFYFLFKKKKPPAPERKEDPWETAYRRLERLKNRRLSDGADLKLYFVELSDIARRYIESRFSIRAPEMTTEEFLFMIKDYDGFSKEQKRLLKEFLGSCDMVKFAGYKPRAKEAEAAFESVKFFVDETKKTEGNER
jgi:hypothetical protein